jgi:hypothetical protein
MSETIDPNLLWPVSGTYRGNMNSAVWDLRIDVDGPSPLFAVSGDCTLLQGGQTQILGSFVVNLPPTPQQAPADGSQLPLFLVSDASVTAMACAAFSPNTLKSAGLDPTAMPIIRVVAQRLSKLSIRTDVTATLDFLPQGSTLSSPAAIRVTCNFSMEFFRQISLTQEVVDGVTPFSNFNDPHTAKNYSIDQAYAQAGISVKVTSPAALSSSNGQPFPTDWNDSELHDAMVNSNQLTANNGAWSVWMLHAARYADEHHVRGLMFEQTGAYRRRACAVFYNAVLGNSTPNALMTGDPRYQLNTCVHEAGHCFNLIHAFSLTSSPPYPLDFSAATWMHYPERFPGGVDAFWAKFNYSFTSEELKWMRHGFLANVQMGESDYADTSASAGGSGGLPLIAHDGSELELRLESPPSFALGEPIFVDLRLRSIAPNHRQVHNSLHPRGGNVVCRITGPDQRVSTYRPLFEPCGAASVVTLDPDNASIYESSYIGFGNDGFYFGSTGLYRIQAFYQAVDGAIIASNVLQIRIRAPKTKKDEDIADLFFGSDQGTLLYLLGSSCPQLQSGNDAFDELIARHPKHPLTRYAHLVKGVHATRSVKRIMPNRTIQVRQPDPPIAQKHLQNLHPRGKNPRKSTDSIDNITFTKSLRALAASQFAAGEDSQGDQTLHRMVSAFSHQHLNSHVLKQIKDAADSVRHGKLTH